MSEVGNEIRRRREALGLTGAQLAEKAGMAPSAVSQIETGKRSPNSASLVKLAEALGVGVGDLYPKALQIPLPLEEPERLISSPPVEEWLREHGSKFGLMSDSEFSEHVLSADLEIDEEGLPRGVGRLIGELLEEEDTTHRALMEEFRQGGKLFPKTAKGPNLVERAFERHASVMRLDRELRDLYSAMRFALINYSRRLFAAERTSDFSVPAEIAEAERRRILEDVFAEAKAA